MTAALYFDVFTGRLFVRLPDETEVPLRDFYVAQRKRSGKTIAWLQRQAGLNHPQLLNLERLSKNGKASDAAVPMLAALSELGWEITLSKEPMHDSTIRPV